MTKPLNVLVWHWGREEARYTFELFRALRAVSDLHVVLSCSKSSNLHNTARELDGAAIEPIITLYVGQIARPGDDVVLYAGAAMSAGAFAAMLAAPAIGRFADAHGHWRVVGGSFAVAAAPSGDRAGELIQ